MVHGKRLIKNVENSSRVTRAKLDTFYATETLFARAQMDDV